LALSPSLTLAISRNLLKSDWVKYENEHKRLSKALGIMTSSYIKSEEGEVLLKSPLDIIKNTYFHQIIPVEDRQELSQSSSSKEFDYETEENTFRNIILSFLTVIFYF
jgi:hypothetical protein